MIYFDNAATSLIKPDIVKREILYAIENYTANPGRSGHNEAIKVAQKIYKTREIIKNFFNFSNFSLIFTKNCTEALNIAIFGTLKKGDHVITTCYEHNSVLRPLQCLKSKGVEVTILDCNLNEFNENLESKIKQNTKLVITTFISNVTGEICDIEDVGKICKKYNILYLVDAAQACGHVEIDMQKLNINMLAFAGHKGLLATTGVGGLLIKEIENLQPLIYGGTGSQSGSLIQPTNTEEDFESGTISSISIIGLGAGLKYLQKNFKNILKKEQNLSKYLYFSLKSLNFIELYSKEDSLNVFSFNIKGIDSMRVANILNEKYSIAVRSGLHCAPLIHKRLGTLKTGAVRVSLDFNNEYWEIDYLIKALKEISNL